MKEKKLPVKKQKVDRSYLGPQTNPISCSLPAVSNPVSAPFPIYLQILRPYMAGVSKQAHVLNVDRKTFLGLP